MTKEERREYNRRYYQQKVRARRLKTSNGQEFENQGENSNGDEFEIQQLSIDNILQFSNRGEEFESQTPVSNKSDKIQTSIGEGIQTVQTEPQARREEFDSQTGVEKIQKNQTFLRDSKSLKSSTKRKGGEFEGSFKRSILTAIVAAFLTILLTTLLINESILFYLKSDQNELVLFDFIVNPKILKLEAHIYAALKAITIELLIVFFSFLSFRSKIRTLSAKALSLALIAFTMISTSLLLWERGEEKKAEIRAKMALLEHRKPALEGEISLVEKSISDRNGLINGLHPQRDKWLMRSELKKLATDRKALGELNEKLSNMLKTSMGKEGLKKALMGAETKTTLTIAYRFILLMCSAFCASLLGLASRGWGGTVEIPDASCF